MGRGRLAASGSWAVGPKPPRNGRPPVESLGAGLKPTHISLGRAQLCELNKSTNHVPFSVSLGEPVAGVVPVLRLWEGERRWWPSLALKKVIFWWWW